MIDEPGRRIPLMLQHNARVANAEIARQVEMAPSAVLERVRKLEERGFVREYTARLEPEALDLGLLAFIFVRTKAGTWQEGTAEELASFPQIEEVHHVAGSAPDLSDEAGPVAVIEVVKLATVGVTLAPVPESCCGGGSACDGRGG